MVRFPALVLVLCLVASAVSAQAPAEEVPAAALGVASPSLSPAASASKRHTYLRLRKDPWLALGYDALLPGAGSLYDGIYVHAIAAFSVSLVGAGLWIAGAVSDDERLWWAGATTFGAGRAYGLIAAPWGAALLNAAFRRQLGIAYRF